MMVVNVLWDSSTPFQVHGGTGHGNDGANHPHEQGKSNTTGQRQDGTWRSKDTSSNDSVEDQERGADHANLTAVFWCCIKDITLICTV